MMGLRRVGKGTAVPEILSGEPTDGEKAAAARQFARLYMMLLSVMVLVLMITSTAARRGVFALLGVGLLLVVAIVSGMMKPKTWRWAAVGLLGLHLALVFVAIVFLPLEAYRPFALVYLLAPVVVASAFYSLRYVVGFTTMNLLLLFIGNLLVPGFASAIFVEFFLFMGGLAMISAHIRSRWEEARQQVLQDSQERYRNLLEIAFNGVVEVEDGRIRSANDGFCQIFGCTHAQSEGRYLSDFIPEVAVYWVGAGDLLELMGRTQQGERLMVELAIRPQPHQPKAYLIAVRDVSAARRAEVVLRQTRDVLEMTVRERTEDLHRSNERLAAQNETLRQLTRLSTAVSNTLELSGIFKTVHKALVDDLQIEGGILFLYDADSDQLTCHDAWGLPTTARQPQFHAESSPLASVVVLQAPLINSRLDVLAPFIDDKAALQVWQSHLSLPLLGRGRVQGILSLFSREPNAFQADALGVFNMLAQQIGEAVQNGRLYEAEQQARELAEGISRANLALSQSLDLDTVLANLLDYLHQIVPFDNGNVMLLTENDARLRIRAARGYGSLRDEVLKLVLPVAAYPTFAEMVRTLQPAIIPDTAVNPDWVFVEEVDGPTIGSWLGVPLVAGGRLIGLYSLDKQERNYFTVRDVAKVEALAAQAAVAVQNALLLAELRQSQQRAQQLTQEVMDVQEAERYRLSRELHDEAGQALTALRYRLEGMQPRLPQVAATAALHHDLEEAIAMCQNMMAQLRQMAHDLRPSALDDLGLHRTLAGLCEDVEENSALVITYSGVELPPLPEMADISLYRLAQEALTNVQRHAGATAVSVALTASATAVTLTISDNGMGLAEPVTPGLGLTGMRERIQHLGGQVKLMPALTQGTVVQATIPLLPMPDYLPGQRQPGIRS